MAEDNDDIIMRSMDIRLEMHLFNAAEQTRIATAISLSDMEVDIDMQVSEKEKPTKSRKNWWDQREPSLKYWNRGCEPGLPMVSPELAACCRNAQLTCKRSWLEGEVEWKEPWYIDVLELSSPSRGQLDIQVMVHVDSTKKKRSRESGALL